MRKLFLPLALLLAVSLTACVSAPPVVPEGAPGEPGAEAAKEAVAGEVAAEGKAKAGESVAGQAPAGGEATPPEAVIEGVAAPVPEEGAVPAPAAPVVPAAPPPPDLAALTAEANKNFAEGYPNTALEKILVVVAKDPAYPGAKLLQAKIYYVLGDSADGLPLLAELIPKGEGGPEALDTYVRWNERLGKTGEAVAFLEKLASEFPQPPDDLLGSLGWCYYSLGDYPKAISTWEKIGDPAQSLKYALILSRLHYVNGDLTGAERWAKEAQNNTDPLLARRGKLALAEVFLARGRASSSRTILEEIVAEAPEDYETLNALGLLDIRQEKQKEAKEAFLKASEANPARPEAFNNLGLVQRAGGEHKSAEENYRKALFVDGNFAPALKNLAVLYEKYMGRFQDAIPLYEKYLTLRPADEEVQKWLKAANRQAGGGQ
ncbi:tetratricopeptide repeat protein [bacterium]|nr:MAG: tetratricopeptide repeat protein [bacterium]